MTAAILLLASTTLFHQHSAGTAMDEYAKTGKTLYLNIIWHQHQPLYLDPGTDQLQGPWVRTHATKDYYDMTAMVAQYPNVHMTVNLTSSLLHQLQSYYVERLRPFVDPRKNRINASAYFKKYKGKTDPWIDLALKPTASFDTTDIGYLLTNVWNAFGISEVMFPRFPEYARLREQFRMSGAASMTEQNLRDVKFWFYLANFDPDFLEAPQKLATRSTVDLTDLVAKRADGTYWLKRTITEDDCNRIVTEAWKVMAAIVPLHKKMMYKPKKHEGQVEVLTTPYYHPILPLIYDSDLAKVCQPDDPMPTRFHYPKDAEAQVAKAVKSYQASFGTKPTGMWPGEGSVAHDVLSVFAHQGIKWVATDEKILHRSKPLGQPLYQPYALKTKNGNGETEPVVVVFRETELSDKIGFVYKEYAGEDAADDFIRNVLRYVPRESEPDRLLTVILDGENAWEWYKYDNDGKTFLHALYRKLSHLYQTRQVVTTTVTEYLLGNPNRAIPAHPVESLPTLEWLWPGSWINANYDTWIGESEENAAWEYLLMARKDLEASGLKQPDPKAEPPKANTKAWFAWRAWEAMYAAEGSDWFWWYGTDQNAPAGDKPFDVAFITHLRNLYAFARRAGAKMPDRDIRPIIASGAMSEDRGAQGTMAQSREELMTVLFTCSAESLAVTRSLFIVGEHPSLGAWIPNRVPMFDDGTHGDEKANDGIWSLEVKLPLGAVIEYKYTNSGAEGEWTQSEEFPWSRRKIKVDRTPTGRMVVNDVFGKL